MNRLKEARKAKGLTQTEVAEYIGLSQGQYSNWEKGGVKIDQVSLLRLAELFEVSVDYLLGGEAPTPPLTLDDFTFAMHNHSGQLTERDKQILLSLAQQLSEAHQEKETNGETDGDL